MSSKKSSRQETHRVSVRVSQEIWEKCLSKAAERQENFQDLLKFWISLYANSLSSHTSVTQLMEVITEELLVMQQKIDQLREINTAILLSQDKKDFMAK